MAATEVDIPEYLCSKKGEREETSFSSEILGEKVKLEISNQVAETVNTQLVETDVLTNESGTFFQALSVPVVSNDDEGTPEICKAATTEDQIVAFKENSQEDIREEKPEEGVNKTVESHVESEEQAVKSEKASEQKDKIEENISSFSIETKENEEKLDEEAIVNDDGQTKKSEEKVKKSEEVKGGGDDVEEASLEIEQKKDTEEMCEEKVEYKEEVKVKDSDNSYIEIKTESSLVKEECEESVSKKAEYEEGLRLSDNLNITLNENEIASKVDVTNSQNSASEDIKETTIGQNVTTVVEEEKTYDAQKVSEECENGEKDKMEQHTSSSSVETKENEEKIDEVNEIVSKEENQEKEKEVMVLEEVKGGEDDVIVISSLNASNDDIKETTISQQTTTVEVEDKLSDAQEDKNEEKPEEIVSKDVESCSETKQEEDIEEIKPSVETEEKTEQQVLLHAVTTDDCIASQTESQVDTPQHEAKSNEAIQGDDDQKETFNKLNENEIVSKVEDQEKEEEVTSSQDAVYEDIKESTIGQHVTSAAYVEENQPKEIINAETEEKSSDAQEDKSEETHEEIVSRDVESCSKIEQEEQDTEEIKSSVDTKEKTEEHVLLHAVTTDDCITTQTESQVDTSEHEAKTNEATQNDDGQKEIFNKLNENEIVSEVEDHEKEQQVTSSHDPVYEDIKETTIDQHVASVAYFEENQPKEIINEETKENSSDAQEASEEQKPEESVSEIIQPYSETEQKEDTEETKPSFETEEKTDQEGSLHVAITDDVTTSQTKSLVESAECEVKSDEAIESDDGQKENFSSPLIKEVCEETGLEKIESEEGLKLVASKIEYQENEQEVYVSSSSQNATCEDIKETTISQHVTKAAYVADEQALSSMPKEILKEEWENKSNDAQEETEQYENGEKDKRDQNSKESVNIIENTEEIKPSVETYETKEQAEITRHKEEAIESDDGQNENSKNLLTKKVCEETETQKAEFEGVELSDKDENQEKEQEPIISEQDQGEKIVRYSQDATSTEGLQVKNYDGEGNEPETVKTRKCLEANTEEIIYSVETKEMEEKIDEEAIVNDYGQTKKSEIPLVKEVFEETDTKKVELEVVELSAKDENQEKKQELAMSEQDQGEETVKYSQDDSSTQDLQVKNYEEDTEEVISGVETKEMEEKIDEKDIVNDYEQTKKFESPLVEEVCEVIGSENVESEEGLTHFESSSRALNQDEIISKVDNQDKEQEPKEVQGGEDNVLSSSKDIEETSNAHEDKTEQKPEESINIVSQSYSDIKQEEDTEEIKPSAEIEQQVLFHAIASQTESQMESVEHEVKISELIQSDDGQKEKVDSPLVNDICEETDSKKVEYSEEVKETTIEDEIAYKVEEVKSDEPIQSDDGQKENVDSYTVNEVCEETDSKKVEYSEEVEEAVIENEVASIVEEVKSGEPIQNDDGHKEIVDTSLVNEVCEETDSKKVEYSEEVQEAVIENEVASIVEEVKSSEPIQSDDGHKEIVDTSLVNEVCEETDSKKVEYNEEVKETTIEDEISNKVEEVKSDEPIQSDDDGQKEIVDTSLVNEVCEETDSKKVQYREEVQETTNENEVASKVEEVKNDEPIQSDDGKKENVDTSLVNEVCEETDSKKVEYNEEVKETTIEDEISNKVEEVKSDEPIQSDDDGQKEIVDTSLVNEVCEETDSKEVEYSEEVKETTIEDEIANKVEEVKYDESTQSDDGPKENVDSSLVNEVCEEIDSKSFENSQEVKETTNDNDTASKIEQAKNDEPIQSDDGQKENVDSSPVNKICEGTVIEKVKYSEDIKETSNENEIASKVEDEEKEQEVYMSGKDQGGEDDVTSSQDATCEDTKETKVGEHVIAVSYLEEGQDPSSMPKEILNEETKEKSSDAQDIVCISAQTKSQEETTETKEKNEESIKSVDSQMEKPPIPSVNEVYEETTKGVCDASEEGVKAIETFKDEDQEKDQEVNKSIEGQGNDSVTSSQVATLEDDLQNESNRDKGKEPGFVEIKESIEEDTEEIKSSVETIEDTYVVSTDIKSSMETETMENEEKIEEEAIVNDDGQTEKSESLLVKEVSEVTGFEKAESELNENETEIVSKEEIQVNEQDLGMLEEVKGNEDPNVKEKYHTAAMHVDEEKETETKEISSDEKTVETMEIGENNSLCIKEDVTQEDQTNSTEDCSKISKDVILTKETVQVQKETDDLKEQIVEEDSHSTELQEKSTEDQKAHVISYLDPIESDESPKEALESVCDVQTPEVVADSEESKVKEESIEYTDEKNGEEEHEVKTNEIASAENLELHGELKPTYELVMEEDQVEKTKSESEQSNIMENVILIEKDLADETTTSIEKGIADEMSSELGQPKEQIVEEIQEGPTKTISEIIEDEITKKDENLSHDKTTKDENCFQGETTREIESVETHNDDLDEVSKQKSTDLNETTEEVEPQEDIVPSSSLVTSTEDTPNSENSILPKEDLESVYDEQNPKAVSKSEDSNLKEDCVTSATSTYVDEEKETVTKEISNDEKTEQITDIDEGDSLYEKGDMNEKVTQENQLDSTEDCSQISKDVILTEETTESKQVSEHPSISSLDAVPIKENLGIHGELKPTSESVIEEGQVKDTKPEQERSDITSENIMKDMSEKDLVYGNRDMEEDALIAPESQIDNTENQNETIKNVILTDEVAVDTVKEKENNEVKEEVSEKDICPTELDKASTSNQKELADEIEYSKLISSGSNEVKEVTAESPTELENIQAAEAPKEKDDELISETKTPETTLNMEMKEENLEATNDTCETLIEGSLSEKKLESMVSPEELTFSTAEDQTNTEQSIEVRSEESKGYADIPKLEEKTTEVFETKSEVAEIAPEGREVSETLPENVPEASPVMLLEKNDSETTTIIAKDTSKVSVIDVQKHEEALDVVSNEECSEIQQQHISKKEAILEENQSEQKKEADENIEREIPTEKESVELDAHVTTTELETSQKDITGDTIKMSQTQPEIQTYEGSACIVEKKSPDEQPEQKEPTEKPLILEPENKASGTEPQCSNEIFKEEKKMSDENEKSQTILLGDMLHEQTKGDSEVAENLIGEREIALTKEQEANKEETGEKGAKTDEENEEEDDKDNQMIDDSVMVEASKDIDVKVHKKSHNILSGVGSKVKHSIAKVKKAITGKSSNSKPPSPKEKDQVIT